MSFRVATVRKAPRGDVYLDARTLWAWRAVEDDGSVVVVVKDDDSTVILEFGHQGPSDSVIKPLERLSAELTAHAATLREALTREEAESVDVIAPAENEQGS
ncbi:hypothetical protein GCM10010399_17150 [Dactylosporangium fulvum]|uniref:Uncharacterized protein n=1 Tax=Dactylosporangium fulvum TaxID=53359 RepID=A0ABY5W057_9ACTN|nr:hypothetical protein [Dactylosporangium fulvum]UWP82775.1 hypothetical protein Dfulv_00130 [Dactylosporangium fulvum]